MPVAEFKKTELHMSNNIQQSWTDDRAIHLKKTNNPFLYEVNTDSGPWISVVVASQFCLAKENVNERFVFIHYRYVNTRGSWEKQ